MKKILLAATAAVALTLSLAACGTGSGTPGTPADEGTVADATHTPAPSPPAPEPGTVLSDPLPMGSPVKSADWTVTVNSIKWDATEEIRAANDGAFLPDDGQVWAEVNVTFTYTGDNPQGGQPADVNLQVVKDGTSVGDQVLVDPPNPVNLMKTLYTGATVTGNVALEIPADVATATGNVIAVSPGAESPSFFILAS